MRSMHRLDGPPLHGCRQLRGTQKLTLLHPIYGVGCFHVDRWYDQCARHVLHLKRKEKAWYSRHSRFLIEQSFLWSKSSKVHAADQIFTEANLPELLLKTHRWIPYCCLKCFARCCWVKSIFSDSKSQKPDVRTS